jgi:HEAT repeat protein
MISSIGEPVVPMLIEKLNEERFKSQDLLRSVLGDIGGISAVQALIGYLRDPDPAIRRSAAFSLSSTEDSSAIPALRELMKDPDSEVRRGVATALTKCGGVAAILDLMGLLQDSESNIRHAAVCGLEGICAVRPVPASLDPVIPRLIAALIDSLVDRDYQVRVYARHALDALADPRAIPGLIAALRQQGVELLEIKNALESLGKAAIPALRQAVNDPNERVRLTAIRLVCRFGDDADALCVAEILRDQDPDARLLAIESMGYGLHTSPLIFEALIERLHDREEDVCIAAIERLGEIENVSAVPHLIECLKVEALAPSAAGALRSFDTREVRAVLKTWNTNKKE